MSTRVRSADRTTTKPAKPRKRLPPVVSPYPVKRFTLEEFDRMVEHGIIAEDERCELICGWLIEPMPPNPPHAKATRRLNTAVLPLLAGRGFVLGVQDPIRLPDSQPLPDLFVAVGPDDRYDGRHPGPADLLLVVEVADTSVAFDRGEKLALYAAARVVQYWIVDIPARRVEVYSQPRGGKRPAYRKHDTYAPGQDVPVVIAGEEVGRIAVNEILP